MINVESLFQDSPIYYQDGGNEMRLVAIGKPVNAICLEWCSGGEWVEVASMRTVAFEAFLERFVAKSACNGATENAGNSTGEKNENTTLSKL